MSQPFVEQAMQRLGLEQTDGNVWESLFFTLHLSNDLLPKWIVTARNNGKTAEFVKLREAVAYIWAWEDLYKTPVGD